jgi:hypothetical protein
LPQVLEEKQKMLNDITVLAIQIEASFPGSATNVKTFHSGSAMLDVRWNGRLFVLAYSIAEGFGVDEVAEEDGFEMGYRFTSNKFDKAAEELHSLLQAAKK